MSETRKLAAILCSDVVGYSRLAGADEDRILARLRALRSDLIDPTIAVHHGRIVKRTGDGRSSNSAASSTPCAAPSKCKTRCRAQRRRTGGSAHRVPHWIHFGDVVEEADGDLMGDGVNIAARLEGVAKPGAICLSEDAYRQVKARLDLNVSDLGPTQLKNIAEPIHVYSLEVGIPARPKPALQSQPPAAAANPRHTLPRWWAIAAVLAVAAFAAGTYSWRSGFAPRMLGLSAAEDKLATAPHFRSSCCPSPTSPAIRPRLLRRWRHREFDFRTLSYPQ